MGSIKATAQALVALIAIASCGGSKGKGGTLGDAGPSQQPDSAEPDQNGAADSQVQACPSITRPDPCTQANALCILDLRTERSSFANCRTGYAWLLFVASCGAYDGVVYAGIDSATTYYFDRSDGHIVGITNTGVTTLAPCQAFDPSFVPAMCDAVDACPPTADAGPDRS